MKPLKTLKAMFRYTHHSGQDKFTQKMVIHYGAFLVITLIFVKKID